MLTMNEPSGSIVVEVVRPGQARRLAVVGGQHAGNAEGIAPNADLIAVSSGATGDLLLVAAHASAEAGGAHAVRRVLGTGDSAKSSLWRIAFSHGHAASHPAAAEAEATRWQAHPGLDDPLLTDLTDLPFVTIDNAGSRDLDQAIHLTQGPGGYRLRYALADASYYVRPGSALFAEALSRGVSFYLPGITIPMLPRSLSEGLISLNAMEVRRSVVMDLQLDDAGRCTQARLVRATIRSVAKLTYAGVQAFYACGDNHPLAHAPYAPTLQLIETVGRLRIAIARAADVVSFQRAEVDVQLDGASFTVVGDARLPIERYNEQLSLLCNTEGARLIARADGEAQGIFKVHPAPPSEKLERFVRLLDAVVHACGLDRDRWHWHQGREPLADYLDRLPRTGDEARISQAIERQAMMTNVSSTFSDAPGMHHGIGVSPYARFTSPMREVVGVFTHKEALEQLSLTPATDPDADGELREQVIAAAIRARQRQTKLTKACNQLVLDTLLARELRMGSQQRWRTGTLLGMSATKLYVRLDTPPIEVKVYLRDLPRDGARPRVSAHGGSFQLASRAIALGERVELRVSGKSERSGRWTFALRFPDGAASDALA